MAFQQRIILSLDENPHYEEAKEILKAPLELVKMLVISCFSEDTKQLLMYEKKLDAIKKRMAGITRARDLSSYKIAEYSSYLFAFQQFFHNSYRARQGSVLEEAIYYSLKYANVNPPGTREDRKKLIKSSFGIKRNVNYDIDFSAKKQDSILLGQIRSTDVTGGTTAKGSLVELLRFMLRTKTLGPPTLYLAVAWEPFEIQQKSSLINKMWDALRSEFRSENEESFMKGIDKGWKILNTNISIKLAYGVGNLGDELNNFVGNSATKTKLLSLWDIIQKWDDLWLTYAIASLELENLIFKGFINFQLLSKKLQKLNITISENDLKNYETNSITIAEELAKKWNEDTIPVTVPSDILNYH